MAGAGYKLFATGDVLTAAQVNTYLMQQTVMVFASSTARSTALSGVLAEGMLSYLQDTDKVEVYNGSTWVDFTGDITGVTASSPLTGGGSSGSVTIGIQDGTTAQKGAVQLTDSTSSTSTTTAATPNSVKSAYDLANGAIPKTLTTTTGDVIYASSANTPARLGIGTTGQILTVSGGLPVWATPSASASGLTFIKRSTFSNVTDTGTTLDSIFSSSYYAYLVVIEYLYAGTATDAPYMKVMYGGSTMSSDYYAPVGGFNPDGTTASAINNSAVTGVKLSSNSGNSQNSSIQGYIYFTNVGNSSNMPYWHGVIHNGYGDRSSVVAGKNANTITTTGIKLYSGSSNIYAAVTVYGLAKS